MKCTLLIGNSKWLVTDYTGNRPSYQNYTTSTAKVFKRKEINIKNDNASYLCKPFNDEWTISESYTRITRTRRY
jgi:hypothetical protein